MEYFNLLEFNKEPFSNSPEPEFLFASPQQNSCLQKLELAIRLRRGLNIVIGDVGTGKTTLCRKLIQNLSVPVADESPAVETFLLLDPAVAGPLNFVKTVASILSVSDISIYDQEWQIKEKIKNFLFEQGVQEQKIIVLIIDEGQKIPDDCLEILREFLNYETNSFKLLQIVIFAQPELEANLHARANLLDRVNDIHHLQPLSFRQTKAMVEHRIAMASRERAHRALFTLGGFLAVYAATGGYPRKVVSLCHRVLIMMIIRGKKKAGWFLVRRCVNKLATSGFRRVSWATLCLLLAAVFVLSFAIHLNEPIKADRLAARQPVSAGIGLGEPALQPPSEPAPPASEGDFLNRTDLRTASEPMPDSLGTISLKRRMTIWRVFDNIYGDTSRELADRFIERNPQLKNIDKTRPGTVIQVPAFAERAHAMSKDAVIVSLDDSPELEDLYYKFTERKDLTGMPALLFLSLWNKQKGMQFSIVLGKRFANVEDAQKSINRLPSSLAASAHVLSGWDDDTVVFNSRILRK
ncbi:AAA family ATPase [bacterium]|nr:AAA family ATPase [bacterium]